MVPLMSLWLPILLSAVFVFVASSIIHMALGYHKNDVRQIPGEDELIATLRRLNVPPGDYCAPHPGSMAAMKEPAFIEKMTKGPVAFMTVAPGGPPTMANSLILWFVYSLVVGLFAAYVAGHALPPGADYMAVFRLAGATAIAGYTLAITHMSIWYKRSWATTLRTVFDGVIYGLLTAGTFGWLWPR